MFPAAIVCLSLPPVLRQQSTPPRAPRLRRPKPSLGAGRIIQDGATEYKIIRPERAGTALVAAASEFRSDLSEATGVQIKIETDWYKTGDEPPETAKEIVVGKCDRPAIDTIVKNLRERDFAIVYLGERIYIVGGNDEATIEGIDYFVANYVDTSAKTVIVPNNLSYIERYEYLLGMVSVSGVNITEYRIVIPDGCGLYTSSAAECLSDYLFYNGGISLEIVKIPRPSSSMRYLSAAPTGPRARRLSAVTGRADHILACTNSKIVITGNSYMVGGGVSEFINSYAARAAKTSI